MSVSDRNSGIHAQVHEKCAMKERNKRRAHKRFFDDRKEGLCMAVAEHQC